jgi:GMP synthase-like glutamine amidotransferase
LIAKALGAKVSKAQAKEIGWYDVSLTETGSQDPLFSNLPKTFSVFQWHGDTFEIPRGGKLIATSSPVSHQAFRYGEKVYGVQFHLEVTEGMIGEWLETYQEEFTGLQSSLPLSKSEIVTETELKIETYTRRGTAFLKHFFRQANERIT